MQLAVLLLTLEDAESHRGPLLYLHAGVKIPSRSGVARKQHSPLCLGIPWQSQNITMYLAF